MIMIAFERRLWRELLRLDVVKNLVVNSSNGQPSQSVKVLIFS